MMGPISGSAANSIEDLKALLEIVSDPKKAAKALDEIGKVVEENKKLLLQNADAESTAGAKLKQVEKQAADMEFRMSAVKERERDFEASQKAVAAKAEELKDHADRLASERAALGEQTAGHQKAVEQFKAYCAKKHAEISQALAEAEATKAEYDAKILKLKQAVG